MRESACGRHLAQRKSISADLQQLNATTGPYEAKVPRIDACKAAYEVLALHCTWLVLW